MCDALEHGHECVFIAVRKYFFNVHPKKSVMNYYVDVH